MKKILQFFVLALTTLTLSACNGELERFVSKSIKLNMESVQANSSAKQKVGELTFSHTVYSTRYRTECEEYICGHDSAYECHDEPRCGYVNGRYVCEGSHRECNWVDRPRYCQGPCHQVPYTSSETYDTVSPITAEIHGWENKTGDAKISALTLGVKTNNEFKAAMLDPSKRPDADKALFDMLSVNDRNILVLEAKGYRLVRDQKFLRLPENFKAGNEIPLFINLEASGTNDEGKTATGTQDDLPALHSSSNND